MAATTNMFVYREDQAHTSTDEGYLVFAVRQDTAASLAGTDGDYVPLIVDSSGRLHVSSSGAATEVHLGQVGGHTTVVKPTVTVTTGAYTAGDTLGGEITLTNAMRVSGGSGVLTDLILTDADSEGAAMQVLIFDSDPASTSAANDAFAWGSGDLARLLGVVVVEAGDWLTIGADDVAHITGINMAVKASGSANLFAHILTTGTPTYTATTDITAAFKFIQD